MRPAVPLLVVLALSPVARAQTLLRVRGQDPDARATAARLELEGRDVLEGSVEESSFDLVVSRAELEALRARGHALEIVAEGRPFREIQAERAAREGSVPAGYPDLAQIVAQMQAAAAAFPAIAQLVDVTATYGTPATFEGRHLLAMRISDNVAQDEDEPAVLIVSAHHCREIVTPLIALEAIDRLTTRYGSDPAVTRMVDELELWIAPIWNPDGYEHVFNVDNLWRKNRRVFAQDVGVDLNRNYPFGWSASCSGSTSPSSATYKGPAPASEAETITMLALHADRHFALVGDFHSFGNEVRYGYGCDPHPWTSAFQQEAAALSAASGYGGATGPSCCLGGQFHSPLATMGALGFLWETGSTFQPGFATGQAEALQNQGGIEALALHEIPLSGHVTDPVTGAPLAADLAFPAVAFLNGETNQSEGRFGRYHAFPPPGTYDVVFSAPGHVAEQHQVTIAQGSPVVLEVALAPETVTYCTGKTNSLGCVPFTTFAGVPSASSTAAFTIRANDLVPGEIGLLLYGLSGRANLGFHNGKLCVKAPLARLLPAKSAAPNGAPPCTGTLARDFNARIQSGGDPALLPGQRVNAQWRQRDGALGDGFGDSLTDGIEFTIGL